MAEIEIGGKRALLAGECVLGRHRDCTIAIGDGSLSRRHARLFSRDGAWWVEDLGSANGTKVNGKALVAQQAVRLADGDQVRIGEIATVFHDPAPMPMPAPAKTEASATFTSYELDLSSGSRPAVKIPAAATPAIVSTGGFELEEVSSPHHPAGTTAASGGPPPEAPHTALAGQVLGNYRIEAVQRQEISGVIYRAQGRMVGEVALKVLDPRLRMRDAEFAKRLAATLILAKGIAHPGAVRLVAHGADKGHLFYAMAPVAGRTLAQAVHTGFTPFQAVATTRALGLALHAYHENGLVHGDIKPASVTIAPDGSVKLNDLGLIGLGGDELRLLQGEGATRQVYYLCPEQARTGERNARSDMYSLGCVMVHLLTGRPPFLGANFQEVMRAHLEQPVPQPARDLHLPTVIDEVLAGLMHKDPFFRFEDLEPPMQQLELAEAMLAE